METIDSVVTDYEESLRTVLDKLKRLLDRTQNPILTVDIIVQTREKFDQILALLVTYFGGAQVLKSHKTGNEQYEEMLKALTDESPGLKIVVDENTYPMVPHDSWMHSQDQGFKDGKYKKVYDTHSKKHKTKLLIVRFCNASDQKQLRIGLALNDFRNAMIKITGDVLR